MLQTNGAYSDVYNLLDGMMENLGNEMITQRQVYDDQMADCTWETDKRMNEIDEANSAYHQSYTVYNKCSEADERAVDA